LISPVCDHGVYPLPFAKTLGVLRFAPVTMLCYEPLGNPLILKALVILANDTFLQLNFA
jgi:hypothetical protein